MSIQTKTMIPVLVLIACLVATPSAQAQWLTQGGTNNIFYSAGFVSVGAPPAGGSAFQVFSNSTGGATLFNLDGGPSATGYRFVLQDQGLNRFRIAPQGTTIIDATGVNAALIVNYLGGGPNAAEFSGSVAVTGNVSVAGNIAAKYQDIAEWVPATKALHTGTVVVLDTDHPNQVAPSTRSYDTRVAGVVSGQPGLLLGEGGDGKAKVATTGRVKVLVDATKHPVKIGDLLVTSDKEGLAMVSIPVKLGDMQIHRPGTILGKALEPLASGQKEILVLLSMQ